MLHAAWRGARTATDRAGRPYRIIYAGMAGGSSGPDFRDAVVETPEGRLVRGDIEIHVRASGWTAHGHHRDPAYNGVVFHIVESWATGEDASGAPVRSASGIPIPLLLLKGACAPAHRTPSPAAVDAPALPGISLAEAGDRRFFARSSGMELALRSASPDELLWVSVLECLGYQANRRPFRRLAERISWRSMSTLSPSARPGYVRQVLLWAAGLGDRPPALGRPLPGLAGAKPAWAARYGRPDNRPQRRIRGAAVLAARWLRMGGPSQALAELLDGSGSGREIVDGLVVPGSAGERALIGRGRAAEISVNAVLPGLHAAARRAGAWARYEKSLALYRSHPKIPGNAITREMQRYLGERGSPQASEAITGAREQQGLIYLYRAMTRPQTAR